MSSKNDLNSREYESYVDTGASQSIEITLSGTPSTVTTVTIPSHFKGFRLYSASDDIRFAVNATVAAVGTSSSQTIDIDDFGIGGLCKAASWETRLLPSQQGTTQRTITLSSLTASSVLTLEVF